MSGGSGYVLQLLVRPAECLAGGGFVPQPLARPAGRLAGRACLEPLARPLDIRRAGLGAPHQPGPEGRDKADRAIGK